MSKHTPGRWYWDFDRDGNWSLHSDPADAGIMDQRNCPMIKDRILIGSAPDLLEALESARTYVEWAYECAFPDAEKNTEILASIDAAIAKAKGESQ